MENYNQEMQKSSYRSCSFLESGITCFPKELVFCCDRMSPGGFKVTKNISDSVDGFLRMREQIIKANQGDNPPCEGCDLFQPYHPQQGKISYLNFSTHCYCQFSCIYCDLGRSKKVQREWNYYDSVEIAKELKRRGLLSEKLHIDCAPGEISIHPYKDRFYDFIEKNAYSVSFATNAGKFDKRLAEILASKVNSKIIVSLDSGTAETFHIVHGINLFDEVIANLKKYRQYSTQIFLKYILLEENCEKEDIEKFVQYCKEIDVEQIIISTDCTRKADYKKKSVGYEHIVSTTVRMIEHIVKSHQKFKIESTFGVANTMAIYQGLLELQEFIDREEKLDNLLSASEVVVVGTGSDCEKVLNSFCKLGLRMPNTIITEEDKWEIKNQLDIKKDTKILLATENENLIKYVSDCVEKNNFILPYDLNLALYAKDAKNTIVGKEINIITKDKLKTYLSDLEKLSSASRVILYGAGKNSEAIISKIERLGLRKPDVIWDKAASTIENKNVTKFGYPICYPEFEKLDTNKDAVFITIMKNEINEELVRIMHSYGFENILTQEDLELALIAKALFK